MKLSNYRKIINLLLVSTVIVAAAGCKKTFDVLPETSVDKAQAYRNVFDADAAIVGIYGKFMKLAKQYVIWNELRGDLADITVNSDKFLRQISEHNVTPDNPYINPQPWYDVINNCNDALANFNIMLQNNILKVDEYNMRYSDVGAIRSWAYLQLGIHFGNIPYVTDPLADVNDLKDATKFPMIPLNKLIDSLVLFTENLPYQNPYPNNFLSYSTTVSTTTIVDGYPVSKFFINKDLLMGDLYLWQGQYDKAAARYYKVLNIQGNEGFPPANVGTQYYNQYRLSNQANVAVSYSRTFDVTSLSYSGWREIFQSSFTSEIFRDEWIWVLPFDKSFAPTNPFIDLFSINGGKYLIRPSQQAINYWNNQKTSFTFSSSTGASPVYGDRFPFDSRGNPFTYRIINGQPVIMKYLYDYLDASTASSSLQPLSILAEQGKWFIERAAGLHLHYAEAANRAGKYKLAYSLINYGIGYHYDSIPGSSTTTRDATRWQQTFLPPPYDFDARGLEAPRYRNTWYRNGGIRGRAGLRLAVLPSTDSVTNIENMIIEEAALEMAYEGRRWSDLLRVAIRRNDPSFIADKVYGKLSNSNLSAGAASAARTKLQNKDWFFPFNW
jgi:hypothetical protein